MYKQFSAPPPLNPPPEGEGDNEFDSLGRDSLLIKIIV